MGNRGIPGVMWKGGRVTGSGTGFGSTRPRRDVFEDAIGFLLEKLVKIQLETEVLPAIFGELAFNKVIGDGNGVLPASLLNFRLLRTLFNRGGFGTREERDPGAPTPERGFRGKKESTSSSSVSFWDW